VQLFTFKIQIFLEPKQRIQNRQPEKLRASGIKKIKGVRALPVGKEYFKVPTC
jgi:hypothetical protein